MRVPYARCKINYLAFQQADSTRSTLLLIRHVIYIIRRCDGRAPNQMKRANASVYVRQVCVCVQCTRDATIYVYIILRCSHICCNLIISSVSRQCAVHLSRSGCNVGDGCLPFFFRFLSPRLPLWSGGMNLQSWKQGVCVCRIFFAAHRALIKLAAAVKPKS